jgi:nucleotide-binding universal stress UspA family protein
MLKTILVALGNDSTGDRVIKSLEELMITTESKIILTHVIPPTEPEVDVNVDRPHFHSEEIYRQIEKQLQTYQSSLPCASEIEIVTGDPPEELIRLAHIYHADLIVIGSRGLTGLKRIIQGSVSSQVVESAPCSVFVIKQK